jgi:NADH-quinone oxidoreductase subunit L
MTGPLAVLAVLSLVGGYTHVPHFLEPVFPIKGGEHDSTLVAISVAAGLGGIALAWFLYVLSPETPKRIAESLGGLYRTVYNKYWVDEIYDTTIVGPLVQGSRSFLWKGLDAGLVDGAVNGVGSLSKLVGGMARRFQTGNIRSYAAWVVLGALLVIGSMTATGGYR